MSHRDADVWWASLRQRYGDTSVLRERESLANKTTFRVGGTARFYAEPVNREALQGIWLSALEAGVDLFLLGRGSNVIVADEGFDGLVIRLQHAYWRQCERSGDQLVVGAGLRLKQLCGEAARFGMAGFEFLEGIPGTVGGALRMNAGAMGGWMFDLVESVDVLGRDGVIRTLNRDAFDARYRFCRELLDQVAIGAVLVSKKESEMESEAIRLMIGRYATSRKESQPREPSAGCIFKNPEGIGAGRLIDELSLKGTRVGGAEVSQTHGNFIINQGNARCVEVIELIRQIRARAKQERGIELEPEVLLLGQKWENVL